MPSAPSSTYFRLRRLPRVVRTRRVNRDDFGCIVVRRITDDAGRVWRVREFHSPTGLGLFFRCEVPGIRSEARSVGVSLESLDEDRLIELLQAGNE